MDEAWGAIMVIYNYHACSMHLVTTTQLPMSMARWFVDENHLAHYNVLMGWKDGAERITEPAS